jgi:hypothetical protein
MAGSEKGDQKFCVQILRVLTNIIYFYPSPERCGLILRK